MNNVVKNPNQLKVNRKKNDIEVNLQINSNNNETKTDKMQLQPINSESKLKHVKIKAGGVKIPTQLQGYSHIAMRQREIIDELFGLMYHTNPNIRLQAIKLLIDRILPAKKSIELTGNGQQIQFNIIGGGFNPVIPQPITPNATPEASIIRGQSTLQSPDMAPSSEEDNHSDNGRNKASTS